jgi:hypothetical protein
MVTIKGLLRCTYWLIFGLSSDGVLLQRHRNGTETQGALRLGSVDLAVLSDRLGGD